MNSKDPHSGMFISSLINKTMMSLVREGDYQHPGEEEAIEKLFKFMKKSPDQLFLDVGCGLGGTAAYLCEKKWGKVIGIDVNLDIVNKAREKYSKYNYEYESDDPIKKLSCCPMFLHGDVMDIESALNNFFKDKKLMFNTIYLFSSFFLFSDQSKALKILRKISQQFTKLVIFDYINRGNYMADFFLENGKALLPNVLKISEMRTMLHGAGWKINSVKQINSDFIKWYGKLIEQILKKSYVLKKEYGEPAFNHFFARYKHILDALENGSLGGAIIISSAS